MDMDDDEFMMPPGFEENAEDELAQRAREWRTLNQRRYGQRSEYKAATRKKAAVPAEYLRKIIRDHGDMSDKKFRDQRRLFVGAVRYMPHAILKLVENMPMPWEVARYVDVVYHVAGAVTIVNETPKVAEPVFVAQWAAMWVAMRGEKKNRTGFRRLEDIPFGNEEEPLDYGDHIMDLDPPKDGAVELELDEDDDKPIADWFYEHKPDLSESPEVGAINYNKQKWRFTPAVMSNLLRVADVLQSDIVDRNYYYLWEKSSFFTAKALSVALPGAPKFQPLVRVGDDPEAMAAADDEDWTEFNDLGKVIVRHPLGTEVQLAFPFLYSREVRDIPLAAYRHPTAVHVKSDDDPDIPGFFFHPIFNPIRAVPCPVGSEVPSDLHLDRAAPSAGADIDWAEGELDDAFELPDGFEPFCAELPLESDPDDVKSGIALLRAAAPFSGLKGNLKRAVDIPLISAWFHEHCPREQPVKIHRSYQRLLKGDVKRQLHAGKSKPGVHMRVIDQLAETKFFQRTRIDWLEAGMQLTRQGHTMLKLLLQMRNHNFVHVDRNFNIMPTKILTTKERKRSRLGQSFHVTRELLKFVKTVVDAHIKFRLDKIDAFQLADAIHYVFTHMATITGVYRYKYRVMRQVQQCRDLKHLIYSRFNTGAVKKGPGTGFWGPAWRVWVMFLRGMTPLLQRMLGNLLTRLFEGRKNKGEAKRVTKQRIESNFDMNLKAALKQTVIEMLPEGLKAGSKARVIEQHANEAFRCWKANIPWVVKGMPIQFERLIQKTVRERADNYVRQTYYNRERINKGDVVDKGLYMKNLGRLTRLKLRDEQERQAAYFAKGPEIGAEDAVAIHQMLARWLEGRNFQTIDFPHGGYKNEKELLARSLDRLRQQHNIGNRLTQDQREEQKRIEDFFDAPQEALNKIREALLKNRIFKTVEVQYMDGYSQLVPVYNVTPQEKMVDAYLDSYLWYEASRRGLFPNWVKPADTEPPPLLAYKWCRGINDSPSIWDTADGETVVMMQSTLEGAYEKVDWTLMKSLLSLILHPTLVDYICSRHDVKVEFKDMSYEHHVGLIRGYQFSSFLAQFWCFVIDLLLLGSDRAAQLAGPASQPNAFMKFPKEQQHLAGAHPTRAYMRYNDRIYVLLRYTRDETDDLISRFLDADPSPENKSVVGCKNKKCWPRDCRMRLFEQDVSLSRAVLWDFRRRLPASMAEITKDTSFVSVYSENNPNLLFDMCGFELRILPLCRTLGDAPESESVWPLKNARTYEITARAHVQVTAEHVEKIGNKLRRCLLSIGNAAFERIAAKWNGVLTEIVPYYREAILGTEGLQATFVRYETKIQNRIKMALNSKMPDRFPPVVFYAPTDIGGLGMVSIGASLIPAKDTFYSKQTDAGTQYFLHGMHSEHSDISVPNVLRCYPAWHREFVDSDRAWAEYRERFRQAKIDNRRVSFDEVEDILDLGVPRVRTLFSKERRVLEHDRGWRVRQEFSQFQFGRFLRNWWFHMDHDGRLCGGLDEYRKTMIQALGGVEAVLEHTLFAGTGFSSWEGLFWDKKGGFEEQKKNAKLTKAQRGGLVQVPNRRFALWWSPTINRSSVYAGFENQIDLTGVKMTGKLEMIKVAMISLFSSHLWEKIHCSVVEDIFKLMQTPEYLDALQVMDVKIEQVHPKKSFTLTNSCADIVLQAATRWPVCKPSLLSHEADSFQDFTTNVFWIDVQLRWGDYDRHNIAQYAREKYFDYTKNSRYPNATGIILAIDLAYNCHAAFGYWIPGVKDIISKAISKIMKQNPTLFMLRTRMRRSLQLYSSDPTEAHLSTQNLGELFSNQTIWLVDDSRVFATSSQATAEGNRKFHAENGALVMLNPRTGQMFLSVIHKSVFFGQKRRSKLAREKGAEEVASWLRSLPVTDRPNRIIVVRKNFISTLTSTLLDYPNIGLGKSDLSLPIQLLMQHPRLGERVSTATESQALRFNVFDDWGLTLSPVSCFNRLVLILRCYHVNIDRARHILQPDRRVVVEEHHFWPTLTMDEWCDVERQLHDVILADYARRHGISVSQLTRKETVDIILGQEMSSTEMQQEQMDEIEKKTKTTLLAAQTTTTVNRLGEEIEVRTTKTFEVGASAGTADWRGRAVGAASLLARSQKIFAATPTDAQRHGTPSGDVIVLPKNVLQRFLRAADLRISVAGLLYGSALPDELGVKEVRCIMLPPQQGTTESVALSTKLPSHAALVDHGLELVGWIRTQSGEPRLTTVDLALQGRLLAENEAVNPTSLAMLVAGIGSTDTSVVAYSVTDDGTSWGMANRELTTMPQPVADSHVQPCSCRVTDRMDGFFLVPTQGSWNYFFRGQQQWSRAYAVQPEVPLDFYHSSHRPGHFKSFTRLGQAEDAAMANGADAEESVFA
jgi:pre-mRNA-processing factor 8